MELCVLGFKCHELWRTKRGLEILNPEFFGFDMECRFWTARREEMQMGEKNRENSLSEIFNDYEKLRCPQKPEQTWFEQGMVWLGSGFGLSGLATGRPSCQRPVV